jgi:hypothetical protein
MSSTYSPLQRVQRGAHALIGLCHRSKPLANKLEWAPSANFILHDENLSTTIGFAPLTTTRQGEARYFWEFRLYDKNPTEPVYIYKSGPMDIFAQETLTSAEICKAAGMDRLFNYCEVMAYSPDVAPTGVSSVLVSYHHFSSRDGSMEAHLPAAYIWGAARYTRTERFHYENYPSARISASSRLVVFTVNPFVRPMNYWIQLTDANGRKYEEGPFRIKGKGVSRWDGNKVPVAELTSPVGVVVRSESKGASFVGAIDVPTGHMVDLEHMHPFFAH